MGWHIEEVSVDDPRAAALRAQLDAELDERYAHVVRDEPPELTAAREDALRVHAEDVVATFVAVDDDSGVPIGHVLLRRLGEEWELKRLIVAANGRRRGVGRALTNAVVERARLGGADRVILQSGEAQPESLALYARAGFRPIPVYEPYAATMPNSLCFELVSGARGTGHGAGMMAG